jgi:hypothetical protein
MKVSVELEVGDVVFLNSDVCLENPMTVEYVTVFDNHTEISVVWFNCGDIQRDDFPPACLTCVE